jgi:hypothetical protein
MKKLLVLIATVCLVACSSGDRESKDLTDEKEENVSPNQTVTEEEQARKDSTDTDYFEKDTASQSK